MKLTGENFSHLFPSCCSVCPPATCPAQPNIPTLLYPPTWPMLHQWQLLQRQQDQQLSGEVETVGGSTRASCTSSPLPVTLLGSSRRRWQHVPPVSCSQQKAGEKEAPTPPPSFTHTHGQEETFICINCSLFGVFL